MVMAATVRVQAVKKPLLSRRTEYKVGNCFVDSPAACVEQVIVVRFLNRHVCRMRCCRLELERHRVGNNAVALAMHDEDRAADTLDLLVVLESMLEHG